MKKIILCCLLLWLPITAAAKPRDLYVSITLIVAEHSRDSNSTKTSFTITGHKVVFEESYSGYRAASRASVRKELKFTEREITNLKRLIQQKDLLRSRSFNLPAESAPFTSYELREEIKWQGKISLIEVSGSKNSLNSDETKNNRLYQDADALLEYVRATVNMKDNKQ